MEFESEGDLPDGGKFFANKKLPIRAYGWYGDGGDFWVSHYVYKDQQKLSSRDIERVHRNWRKCNEH